MAVLTPYIEQGAATTTHSAGKVLGGHGEGRRHDIGKNIVSVVMACNGYEIRDLGVMVEAERIVDEAVAWGAQVIGLSGLITPVTRRDGPHLRGARRRGLRIPVIIGGRHDVGSPYGREDRPGLLGAVIHSANASQNTQILARLLGNRSEAYVEEVKQQQAALREEYAAKLRQRDLIPIVEVHKARRGLPPHEPVKPLHTGRLVFPDFDISDAEPFIDWNFFFPAWGSRVATRRSSTTPRRVPRLASSSTMPRRC